MTEPNTVAKPGTSRAELKVLAEKLIMHPSQPLEFERLPNLPSIKDVHYETLSYPRQCRLATIDQCSARCVWCHGYGEDRTMDGSVMPFSLIANIVNEIATWSEPLYEIVPVGFGEFFLRKDWYDVLLYISDHLPKTRIWIPTNGSALTPQAVEKLASIKTLAGLNLSINAYFQESYVKTMSLPPWVMQRCEDIAEELHRLNSSVIIWASMVYTQSRLSELEKDLFRAKWAAHPFVKPQVLTASSAGMKFLAPIEPLTLPCRSIFSDMVLDVHGRVLSCCWDSGNTKESLDLGNITDSSILEQWRGTKFNKLREIHNAGKRAMIPLCKSCTFA